MITQTYYHANICIINFYIKYRKLEFAMPTLVKLKSKEHLLKNHIKIFLSLISKSLSMYIPAYNDLITLRKIMQSKIGPGEVNWLRPKYIYYRQKNFAPRRVNQLQLNKIYSGWSKINLAEINLTRWRINFSFIPDGNFNPQGNKFIPAGIK